MKARQLLHELGQSIWLDNITRDLLDSGTLKDYIYDLSAGTENIYKIYAESFKDQAHLDAILIEAQEIVNDALSSTAAGGR
jgi:transaldolase